MFRPGSGVFPLRGGWVCHDTGVMTQRRLEAEVSFRFRGALARGSGRVTRVDRTVTASTDRGAPRRTIRVDDELWSRAKAVAAERGDDVSAVIRRALEAYVRDVPAVDVWKVGDRVSDRSTLGALDPMVGRPKPSRGTAADEAP